MYTETDDMGGRVERQIGKVGDVNEETASDVFLSPHDHTVHAYFSDYMMIQQTGSFSKSLGNLHNHIAKILFRLFPEKL